MWVLTNRLFSCRKSITLCKLSPFSSVSAALQINSFTEQEPLSVWDNSDSIQHFVELNAFSVVEEILHGVRKEPNLALSFFRQLKDRGFQYDVNNYLDIVIILCDSGQYGILRSLFFDLIRSKEDHPSFEISFLFEALSERYEDKGNGDKSNPLVCTLDVLVKVYVSLGMFDEASDALFQIRRCGILPHVKSCNYLMNCLVECGKLDMAVSIYQQLKRLGLSPNVYTYAILIKAFCKKGDLLKALDLFLEMDEAGITPDAYTHSTLIDGLCLHGLSEKGYEWLKEQRGKGIPIDIFGYNAVIRGFCSETRLHEAEDVLHDMGRHGVLPDVYSYSSLIHGYCKDRNLPNALALHDEMVVKGIKTNCFTVSSILNCFCRMDMAAEAVDTFQKFKDSGIFLDEVAYNVVIDAFCKMGKVEAAVELLDEMKSRRLVPDTINYTTLIYGYCLLGRLDDAKSVFKEMLEMGPEPDIITYNVLVDGLSRGGFAQQAVRLLPYMEDKGFKANDITHNIILKGLCKEGRVKEAEAFLEGLEEKCTDAYSAMVKGYCEAKCTRDAYGLFVRLSTHGTLVSKKACSKLFNSLCAEEDLESAFVVFEKTLDLGKGLSLIVYSKLIAAFCRSGNMSHLTKAQHMFDKLVQHGLTPDVITYTTMMNGYCKANCLQKAYGLFLDMMERGIRPDVFTFTVLIDGHQKVNLRRGEGKTLDILSLCSDMAEMKVKPDIVFYTVLIDGRFKVDDVDGALKLFGDMMDIGLTPDTTTYRALVSSFYIRECGEDCEGQESAVCAVNAAVTLSGLVTLSCSSFSTCVLRGMQNARLTVRKGGSSDIDTGTLYRELYGKLSCEFLNFNNAMMLVSLALYVYASFENTMVDVQSHLPPECYMSAMFGNNLLL
ncbi:Pentatricopeptide repeat [Macleaya cordata]|uniref:Pentatricopeptide repeat n=1 Tax=Macleaya cordata TaxID=56857 RepID=A0A200QRM8_MACCD|nr:Pentatricopeptide repeat [Macleaya cordata]